MAAPVFHVRRLTQAEYSTPISFETVLNAIVIAGGTIVHIVACAPIQPLEPYGYYWIDVIYTK